METNLREEVTVIATKLPKYSMRSSTKAMLEKQLDERGKESSTQRIR